MIANLARTESAGALRRSRTLILSLALPALVVKLVLAATTYGTNDILHWGDFLQGERMAGPVGIYSLSFPNNSFYNHPPLIGYLLAFLNLVQDAGVPYRFSLRAISSLADVGTSFVVFELVRRRRPLRQAMIAAILVATSPALVMVSGFHGNTDPIFVLLSLLGLFLLVDRRMPVAAGVAIALAVGIKIVPMVVIPALAVYAFRGFPRQLGRFVTGFTVVFAITWGPALIGQFGPVRLDVIGYSGVGYSRWGIMQIGHWLGDPPWVAALSGPGRSAVVVVCALVPAVAVWRRPATVVTAVAWSLIGMLALAPTWGVQYMVWPLAAAYLIGLSWATVYNLAASIVLFIVYDRWSGGLPWYRARATFAFPHTEVIVMIIVWAILVLVLIRGTIRLFPTDVDGAGGGSGRRYRSLRVSERNHDDPRRG